MRLRIYFFCTHVKDNKLCKENCDLNFVTIVFSFVHVLYALDNEPESLPYIVHTQHRFIIWQVPLCFLSDRKFATKARLNLVLLITLNLIKNNLYNFKNLQSLLQVFKAYTNNSKLSYRATIKQQVNISYRATKTVNLQSYINKIWQW